MKNGKIPDGFVELVDFLKEKDEFSYESLSTTKDDVWKEMVWHLFLSGSRSDAAINYIFDLLDENGFIDYEKLS